MYLILNLIHMSKRRFIPENTWWSTNWNHALTSEYCAWTTTMAIWTRETSVSYRNEYYVEQDELSSPTRFLSIRNDLVEVLELKKLKTAVDYMILHSWNSCELRKLIFKIVLTLSIQQNLEFHVSVMTSPPHHTVSSFYGEFFSDALASLYRSSSRIPLGNLHLEGFI